MDFKSKGIVHFTDGHTENIVWLHKVKDNHCVFRTSCQEYIIINGNFYKRILTKYDGFDYVKIDSISHIDIYDFA